MKLTDIALSTIIFLSFSACKKESANKPAAKTTVVKETTVLVEIAVANGATVPSGFADTVKKAQDLLARVFSSSDFKDELYKMNFSDSAYSKTTSPCFNRVYGGILPKRSIAGKSVYDNLLYKSSLEINVNIKNNGSNTTTMGSASVCGSAITTNDYWLKLSEQKLAYRLARHWAHEYTHIRGYRHDSNVPTAFKWGNNPELDPAYGVGEVVGQILDKWITTKVISY